ncbi:hypothetical protein GUITHDRAFT_115526 [Guillardia theta CCMP2712]|uniref:Uncharacterized protein n=1 Tax=Guillardia theta (strain CCMP2712) TaxID=905079 RepID=L1IQ30_GUITC|nr:hypothetical protein GUITHDRAFT_115526 [Guillardia theta CCMP2712]EKX38386.1 hypothetical protein GUITHDRAFT_115526 [Guillardia theta CCMP2712]|eukprot:XP_005825366.1 hypothetical protein GUITHDRAFT_115526 [Guillardia theta CCMP2712]
MRSGSRYGGALSGDDGGKVSDVQDTRLKRTTQIESYIQFAESFPTGLLGCAIEERGTMREKQDKEGPYTKQECERDSVSCVEFPTDHGHFGSTIEEIRERTRQQGMQLVSESARGMTIREIESFWPSKFGINLPTEDCGFRSALDLFRGLQGFVVRVSSYGKENVVTVDPNYASKVPQARVSAGITTPQSQVVNAPLSRGLAVEQRAATNAPSIPVKKLEQPKSTGHNAVVASKMQVNSQIQQSQSVTREAHIQQSAAVARGSSNLPHVVPTLPHSTSNKPAEQAQQAERWSSQQVLSWLRSTLNKAGVQEKAIDLYTKKFQLHGKLLNRFTPMLI